MGSKIYRHNPIQERSKCRVAVILSSSELIFAQVGYEAATTNAIAEHAGIPIGSLYQYFKNKNAILRALSDKYSAEIKQQLAANIPNPVTRETILSVAESLIDLTAQFYVEHPAFVVVFYGSCCMNELADVSEQLHREIISIIVPPLRSVLTNRDETEISTIAEVLLLSSRSLYPKVVKSDRTINERYLIQTKKLIISYLRALLVE